MKKYIKNFLKNSTTFLQNYFSRYFVATDTSHENHTKNHTTSYEKTVCIPYKKLNWIVSGLVVFGIMNFLAGYFWGQRKAVEYFIKRIEEDSFADRISYALYTMNDRDSLEFEDSDTADTSDIDTETTDSNEATDLTEAGETTDSEDDIELEIEIPDNALTKDKDGDIKEKNKIDLEQTKAPSAPTQNVIVPKRVYFARLAGFGSLKPAKAFLDRVLVFDPKASIVERMSKSARGKKVVWYQVITNQFDDKKDLDRIVGYIKNKEHINGVQIVDQMQDVTATQKKG